MVYVVDSWPWTRQQRCNVFFWPILAWNDSIPTFNYFVIQPIPSSLTKPDERFKLDLLSLSGQFVPICSYTCGCGPYQQKEGLEHWSGDVLAHIRRYKRCHPPPPLLERMVLRLKRVVWSILYRSSHPGKKQTSAYPPPPSTMLTPSYGPPFSSTRKVLHIQNPGELQTFKNVAGWLKEATGAQLEGVSMDEFRGRLSKAVEEKGPQDVGVLAQVWVHGSFVCVCFAEVVVYLGSWVCLISRVFRVRYVSCGLSFCRRSRRKGRR